MTPNKILNAAAFAAKVASGLDDPDAPELRPLYAYCRERSFPQPETLARKWGEMIGKPFPFTSIAEAPEDMRIFFTVFRGVAEMLEPFRAEGETDKLREELDATEWPKRTLYPIDDILEDTGCDDILEDTGCSDPKELSDMAKVGNSLMASIDVYGKQWPLKDWTPAEDPAEIVGDLVNMLHECGRTTEDIARVAHEVNRAYCKALGDDSQPAWEDAPAWQKGSAIAGVQFHANNPDASPSASHDSWLAEKTRDGWKYGLIKDPEKKEHPCFLPYEQLPVEQRAKDFIFAAVCRALMHSTPSKPDDVAARTEAGQAETDAAIAASGAKQRGKKNKQ